MLGLKARCVHPATEEPYIKSSVGGLDKSIEGMQARQKKHALLHGIG